MRVVKSYVYEHGVITAAPGKSPPASIRIVNGPADIPRFIALAIIYMADVGARRMDIDGHVIELLGEDMSH